MTPDVIEVVICSVGLLVAIGGAMRRQLTTSAARARLAPLHRIGGSAGVSARLTQFVDRRRARRHPVVSPAHLADLLDQTARRCSSGESLTQSFGAALDHSPLIELFAPTSAALRSGDAIESALERQPRPDADVTLAVHVLRLCAAHGGNVSESLDRAASTLRERETVASERIAQSSQARLSARVLTLLPIGFGGWTLLTTPAVRRFTITPLGIACLTVGLVLNVTGWKLMTRVSGSSA